MVELHLGSAILQLNPFISAAHFMICASVVTNDRSFLSRTELASFSSAIKIVVNVCDFHVSISTIDHLHMGVAYRAGVMGGHIVTYLLKHITAEISMLSNYAEKLSGDGKKRYIDKLSLINRVDPYTLTSSCLKSDTLPKIEMPDMFNYLVLGTSTYTSDQYLRPSNLWKLIISASVAGSKSWVTA